MKYWKGNFAKIKITNLDKMSCERFNVVLLKRETVLPFQLLRTTYI